MYMRFVLSDSNIKYRIPIDIYWYFEVVLRLSEYTTFIFSIYTILEKFVFT
jgi:hypothetical protein